MNQTDSPPPITPVKNLPPLRSRRARTAFNAGVLFLIVGVAILGLRMCGLLDESAGERWATYYRLQGANVGLTDVSLMDDLAGLTGYKAFTAVPVPDFLRRSEIDSLYWPTAGPEKLPELGSLHYLEKLRLPHTELTPELIARLKKLKRLKQLDLPHSKATDKTLAPLCQSLESSPGLFCLYLGNTQITAPGLQSLTPLKALVDVRIQSPHLSNYSVSMKDLRAPPKGKTAQHRREQ